MFNQPTLLLHTADGAAGREVSEAYVTHACVEPETISTRGFDTKSIRVWDRSESSAWQVSRPDIFSGVVRFTTPAPEAVPAYEKFKTSSWPVRLYMASDHAEAKEPLSPPIVSRDTEDLYDERKHLSSTIERLHDAVIASFEERGAVYNRTQFVNMEKRGFYDD